MQRHLILWVVTLLYVLAGEPGNGVLGEIVVQAGQASVVVRLGGDPSKARAAPKKAFQRKLLDGPRHVVRTDLTLNERPGSDEWFTEDALRLVRKTVCDKLGRTFCHEGIDGIPSDTSTLKHEIPHMLNRVPSSDNAKLWLPDSS